LAQQRDISANFNPMNKLTNETLQKLSASNIGGTGRKNQTDDVWFLIHGSI
jgi:hypothetical protein